MTSMKHTPGPWSVFGRGVSPPNLPWVGSEHPDIPGGVVACPPSDWPKSMEDWPANAALIAAAPDLLAGATEAIATIDNFAEGEITISADVVLEAVASLRAAITKAEGGAA